jgi:hypothetical protein
VRFVSDMWGIWNGHAYNYALTFFVTCWSCGKLDNYAPLGSSNYINDKRNHVDF